MTWAGFWRGLFFVLVLLVLAPYIVVTHGFVLSKLWLWFLVPIGLPVIGLWQGAGICLIVEFLTHQPLRREGEDKYIFFLCTVCWQWLVLLIGWLIRLAAGL